MKCVILAGGSGERFWPLSTLDLPKQFLKLFGEKSLLRQTFERLSFEVPPHDIFVVTNKRYVDMTARELPELPKENIIPEPERKNTAPACTLASLMFGEEEILFVAPSDHYIPETERFWDHVKAAKDFLEDHEGIMTFGILPTRVETGYGYIEVGERVADGVFKAVRFHEKPDHDTASFYVQSGNYLWNSGMFMYRVGYFVEQMKKHAPQVIEPFLSKRDLVEVYREVPSVSIDHALMEKADRIYVMRANFTWSDVGNFKSLKELGMKSSGHVILRDSENVFALTTKPTVVIGVKDVVIVESEHGILVCDMEQTEKIRNVLKDHT